MEMGPILSNGATYTQKYTLVSIQVYTSCYTCSQEHPFLGSLKIILWNMICTSSVQISMILFLVERQTSPTSEEVQCKFEENYLSVSVAIGKLGK